jgi:hypothetical protein
MVPVREMVEKIYHVAHGTAAITGEKPLQHVRTQRKADRRVSQLFDEAWVKELEADESLDR